ncbi:hypothetical protein A3Q56_08775 [Intoshia linei]|uniref:Uncharacterized protein n=1 Tax=Intoshia linei TaxID=1819745 RepID=A0A177AN80_9BILA|nr:hypothetical protein A3Q56_08775 [Intoshia linei]
MELNPQTLSVESAKCFNSLNNFKYNNIYNNVTHCRPNIDTFLANPDIQQKLHRLPSLVRGYLDKHALMLLSKLYNDNSEKSLEKFNLEKVNCSTSTKADKMRLISMIKKKIQDLKFRNVC